MSPGITIRKINRIVSAFYLTKSWSVADPTPPQSVYIDYVTITEEPTGINYISCSEIDDVYARMIPMGVNMSDTTVAKNQLNNAFRRSYSYAYYNTILEHCSTYASTYVLPERGNEKDGRFAYRFGFNGQEKDDEVAGKGNSYTAEFWQYDPRLGRRFNLDPKPNPSISSYATFANNPIWLSDVNRDTTRIFDRRGRFLGQINDSRENQVHFMNKWDYNKITKQNKGVKGISDNEYADKIRAKSVAFYGTAVEAAMKKQLQKSIKNEREYVGVLVFKQGSRELEYIECTSCHGNETSASRGPIHLSFKGRKLFAVTHTHWQAWDHAWRPSPGAKTPGLKDGDPRDHDDADDYRPILNMGRVNRILGVFGGHPALIIHRKGITIHPTYQYLGLKGEPKHSFDNETVKSDYTIVPYSGNIK